MWKRSYSQKLPDGRIAVDPRVGIDEVYDYAPHPGWRYMGRDAHGWHIFEEVWKA